jgi:hypothetical protein
MDFGGRSRPAEAFAGRCRSTAAYKDAVGAGATQRAGVKIVHEDTPQGPSHIAPIAAQPSKAMATGPRKTQAARKHRTRMRRELMTSTQYDRRQTPRQGFVCRRGGSIVGAGLDIDSPTGYVVGVRLDRVLEVPETNVAIFAFLLNLTWEFAQVPLFAGMPSAEHWRAILVCGRATLGDVVISLVAFWTVAACARARSWVLRPAAQQVSGFVAVGVLITIVMEWLATQVLGRWAYGEAMPVVPLLGVGLALLLQWIVLPPIVVWFVRRQLT